MKNTNPKAKFHTKRLVALMLSVVMLFSAATATLLAVSAHEMSISDVFDFKPIYYVNAEDSSCKVAASDGENAVININVAEAGYYSMFVSKNKTDGSIPHIAMFDENETILNFSYANEFGSMLRMFLEPGVTQVEITYSSYSEKLDAIFCVVHEDSLLDDFNLDNVTDLPLGTEVVVAPEETKTFRIKNDGDWMTNFICSQGAALSVEVFDANFTSVGYEESFMYNNFGICKYIEMNPTKTEYFYVKLYNHNPEDAIFAYLTEKDMEKYTNNALVENTPAVFNCPQYMDEFYGFCSYVFTPEETREYDFEFITDSKASVELYMNDLDNLNTPVVMETNLKFNGNGAIKGVELSEGHTYSIFIGATLAAEGTTTVIIK